MQRCHVLSDSSRQRILGHKEPQAVFHTALELMPYSVKVLSNSHRSSSLFTITCLFTYQVIPGGIVSILHIFIRLLRIKSLCSGEEHPGIWVSGKPGRQRTNTPGGFEMDQGFDQPKQMWVEQKRLIFRWSTEQELKSSLRASGSRAGVESNWGDF